MRINPSQCWLSEGSFLTALVLPQCCQRGARTGTILQRRRPVPREVPSPLPVILPLAGAGIPASGPPFSTPGPGFLDFGK